MTHNSQLITPLVKGSEALELSSMSTTVSTERDAILQTVRDFAEAEIRPHVMEWDEAQRFPHEVFRKLGELGLLGTIFPEEYGGAGISTSDYAAIVEEVASVDGSVALALAAHTSLGPRRSAGVTCPGSLPGNGWPPGD
jgi:alkylation response protein AidB-like acyl-CoA dehydrogenase